MPPGGLPFLRGTEDAQEAELIQALLRKDRKATEEFISRYGDAVYGYLSRRLFPHTDVVEDCFQQVFLDAWESLPAYRAESGLKPWLLGIARHKVQDHYRAKLRFAQWDDRGPIAAEGEALETWVDRKEMHSKVWKILESLPETYRILLIWRYWEEKSAEEMAGQTGKTLKAVERGLARARDQFRRRWQNEVDNG